MCSIISFDYDKKAFSITNNLHKLAELGISEHFVL